MTITGPPIDLDTSAVADRRLIVRTVRTAGRTRAITVSVALTLVTAATFCISISVGDFPIPLSDVVPAIFGHGNPDSDFIIRQLRLPRALTAVLVGAAFGLSGAIFQSLAHQKWFRQWTSADETVTTDAMHATGTIDLASRPVDELSGGQRQRVWIAMALAQGTDLMLLDEPTTFLDLAHQVELLDLLVDLNQREQRTIVLVLHDLNHAARYSHHLIAMSAGRLVAHGPPAEVITEALVEEVFKLRCRVLTDPVSNTPMVLPIGRHHNIAAHSARSGDVDGAAASNSPEARKLASEYAPPVPSP